MTDAINLLINFSPHSTMFGLSLDCLSFIWNLVDFIVMSHYFLGIVFSYHSILQYHSLLFVWYWCYLKYKLYSTFVYQNLMWSINVFFHFPVHRATVSVTHIAEDDDVVSDLLEFPLHGYSALCPNTCPLYRHWAA